MWGMDREIQVEANLDIRCRAYLDIVGKRCPRTALLNTCKSKSDQRDGTSDKIITS